MSSKDRDAFLDKRENSQQSKTSQNAHWMNLRFRTNPDYQIVPFERLSSNEKENLRPFCEELDFYGILKPIQESGLTIKSICRDTALLAFTLREGDRLPQYLFGEIDTSADISRLVLDEILQIEIDGKYCSGPTAAEHLADTAGSAPFPHLFSEVDSSRIAKLSIDALKYAQNLEVENVTELALRLYYYNSRPASRHFQILFSAPNCVHEALAMAPGNRHYRSLHRNGFAPDFNENSSWICWRRKSKKKKQNKSVYKLYISPACEQLLEVLPAILNGLGESEMLSFKIGGNLHGLLRPDKMVAYFDTVEDLDSCAQILSKALSGAISHGTPFTADINGDGILSWGVDPPNTPMLNAAGEVSWRIWIAHRLANALSLGKSKEKQTSAPPWQFALQRLHLEGVDVVKWAPQAGIWQDYRA